MGWLKLMMVIFFGGTVWGEKTVLKEVWCWQFWAQHLHMEGSSNIAVKEQSSIWHGFDLGKVSNTKWRVRPVHTDGVHCKCSSTHLPLPMVRGSRGAVSLLQLAGMVGFGSLSQWTSERVNYGQFCVNHFRWRRRRLWLMPRIYWAEVKSVCVFQCSVTYKPFQLQGTTQHKRCFLVMLTSDDESFSLM